MIGGVCGGLFASRAVVNNKVQKQNSVVQCKLKNLSKTKNLIII